MHLCFLWRRYAQCDGRRDCDDGEETSWCDSDCTTALCGDGYVNAAANEKCDPGIDSVSCNDDCTFSSCGDGQLNQAAGEECDDGNDIHDDDCDLRCRLTTCDDEVRNRDEADIDCGGSCPGCNGGQHCRDAEDCASAVCKENVCAELVVIELDNDRRRWSNGTYALSCEEYLHPKQLNYYYRGTVGSGLYDVDPLRTGVPQSVYCDMTTDGGGWTLVALNSVYSIPPQPNWAEATEGNTISGELQNDLTAFDQWLGVGFWNVLGRSLRLEMGASPTDIQHRAEYTFLIDGENNYAIRLTDGQLLIGDTQPGLKTYHNGLPLSTYDSGGSCSATFNNTPWWYSSCWSGSLWGGGGGSGYANAAYWTSSSGPFFDWGAIWLR